MSRLDLADGGFAVLRAPRDPLAACPETGFHAVVAGFLGEGAGQQGGEVCQHAGEEGVLVCGWGNGDVGVGGGACDVGEGSRVESCAEAVALGDVDDDLAGFEEGVDCA